MQRFVRVGGSAAPGDEPGGGGQSSSSRTADAGDDLEVSSNSSGETLEAAALPEGLDVNWALPPQTWHLARWCVARACALQGHPGGVAKTLRFCNARQAVG